MPQADQIFKLGENLADRVRDAVSNSTVRLAEGICDGLAKLVAHRLIQPVIAEPHLRLMCIERKLNG